MNREDIIRMAREAGFHAWYTQPEEHPDHVAIIERFFQDAYDAGAAAEREKQAEAFQQILTATRNDTRAAEREACAQIVDDFGDEWMCDAHMLSKIIRARNNT